MQNLKILKDFIPPILIKAIASVRVQNKWSGDYKNWEEAKKYSYGYDSGIILERVKTALLKVKSGDAIFERDSVTFDKTIYSWPLLSCLSLIAANNQGCLNIIDFGGSLGSLYFQYKELFKNIKEFKWNVVEQENFVKTGKEIFANSNLKFFYTIEEAIGESNSKSILLSSVLPYIQEPYTLLKKIIINDLDNIIIDRTPFISGEKDRLTIQKVPESIYKASYPAWFLSEKKMLSCLKSNYNLVYEFSNDLDKTNIKSIYKGYFFRNKKLAN